MRCSLFFALLLSTVSLAAPVITIQVDPSRSSNGDPVLFKIKIRNDSRDRVQSPTVPVLADWDILNVSEAAFPSSILKNGQVIFRYEGEFAYVLKPLRKGTLRIPGIEIQIGSKTYKTDPVSVVVDNLPQGASQRPRYQARPQPPPAGTSPLGPSSPSNTQQNIPEVETIFLRAEASKTVVFQGQLITLSYALYQADNNLANLEPAKFPSFNGFLKEELVVPKMMSKTPVEIGGRNLFRSEIIRYAVFPLKTGVIAVEPMSLRADYLQSPRDVLNSLMMGQIPQNMGGFDPIPIMKSSQDLKIVSKPLPPAPAGTQFSGAVGQFKIDLVGPRGNLQVDQPFNVNLTIAGLGNVKSIEEPMLKLPASIEPYQSKNSYEFREDATGHKTFEYLLLPRKNGKFTIEPITWTYFDPDRAQYVDLKTPSIEIQVEGNAAPSPTNNSGSSTAPVAARFNPVRTGAQDWTASFARAPLTWFASPVGWVFQALLYLALSILYWRKRHELQLANRFAQKPWEKTEKTLKSQREWARFELANLADQWMRERLVGALGVNALGVNSHLHSESPREEILDSLRPHIHPQHHRDLDLLRKTWSDLDLMRFAGLQGAQEKVSRDSFAAIQRQVESVVNRLNSDSVERKL